MSSAVQKRLNRSTCHLCCRLRWTEGNTSCIAFANVHKFNHIRHVAPMYPCGRAHGATWQIRLTRPSAGALQPYAKLLWPLVTITFCLRRSRGKMYIGYKLTAVCVLVCLSLAAFPQYCMDPHVNWRNGRGWPLVVHYWVDLQSVHGFHCYNNILEHSAKCEMSASVCTRSMSAYYLHHT